jgi:Uma2 family endonuclease
LERQDVYARLGVPELWRYNGRELRVFRLGKSQKYRQVKRSVSFPPLPLDEVHQLLQKIWDISESRWEDAATEWAARLLRAK